MKKLGLILMLLLGMSVSFSQELVWTSNIVSSFLTSSVNEINSIEDYLTIQDERELVYDGTCFADKIFRLTSTNFYINSTWVDKNTGENNEENHVLKVENLKRNGNLLEFDCISNNPQNEVFKVIINLDFFVNNSNSKVFYLSNTVRNETIKGIVMFNCKIVSNTF
jgi:hypothetical protein